MTKIKPAVAFLVPGSKTETAFQVVRTHDGKLRFHSDRSIGIYDPKKGKAYYSTRGNTPEALQHKAREIVLPEEIISALDSVAILSENARKKLEN